MSKGKTSWLSLTEDKVTWLDKNSQAQLENPWWMQDVKHISQWSHGRFNAVIWMCSTEGCCVSVTPALTSSASTRRDLHSVWLPICRCLSAPRMLVLAHNRDWSGCPAENTSDSPRRPMHLWIHWCPFNGPDCCFFCVLIVMPLWQQRAILIFIFSASFPSYIISFDYRR